MYLDTTSSVETSSKPSVYQPLTGFEPFSTYDHNLRNANYENSYGLSPMFNQYNTQALWKAVNDHVDNARSDTKLGAGAFDNSLDIPYSTDTLWKVLNAGIADGRTDIPTSQPEVSDSSKPSKITVNVEQSSKVTTSEQISPTSSESSSQSGPAKKKARTVFSNHQLRELQSTFSRKKYLTTEERMKLATEIGLSHSKIKTWFQNRRMKWKRENHCTIPGLIPMNTPDLLPPNPANMPMSNTPVYPYPSTTSHLQMPSTLPLLTSLSSCLPSMSQPSYTNGYYTNSSMPFPSPAQNLFSNDFRFSPMPSVSLDDAPTYDTTDSLGYSSCSKFPYQPQSTYGNRDSLLMVAPPTQPFLTL